MSPRDFIIESDLGHSARREAYLDRVLQVLLAKGVISPSTLALLLEGSPRQAPKWRELLSYDDIVSPDRLYRTAATVYGFKHVELSSKSVCMLAQDLVQKFSWSDWRALLERETFPIAWKSTPDGKRRLVFASYDPSRACIHRVLRSVRCSSFELVFAERLAVMTLIPLIEDAVRTRMIGGVSRAA